MNLHTRQSRLWDNSDVGGLTHFSRLSKLDGSLVPAVGMRLAREIREQFFTDYFRFLRDRTDAGQVGPTQMESTSG